ncbi:MAG TPA: aminoacyl-tRNA hydrolase, partial [Propionibacteriaceae bacterium]|nr:aminoacyl-tRNA hydrolase [Propionibacteriaceae bacterium]
MSIETAPWLVVGLGNPGPEYAATRHNAGFLVVEELAARARGRFARHKRAHAQVAEERVQGQRAVLAKPSSYMNESGGPVKGLLDFYKVPLDRLVVVHDELDIPFGALRLKMGGGDNGHNGLKSIRRSAGSGDFLRVRF